MPTAKGAQILVCKAAKNLGDQVVFNEEVPSDRIKDTLNSYMKAHKKQLTLSLLLGYQDYQLVLLEDKGIVEPELSKMLPWESADYLPYLPEEGEFFYLRSKRENMLYVFSFHLDQLLAKLSMYGVGFDWFDSVSTIDCAWANYLVSHQKQEQALLLDVTSNFTRILYVEAECLESVHKFDPIRTELDVLNLSKYIKDNFQDVLNTNAPIFVNNLSDAFLKSLEKAASSKITIIKTEELTAEGMLCLGGGLINV